MMSGEVANEMVVDVSQDWLQACSIQERFMRGPGPNQGHVDYGASCRQMRALGGDCYDFSCQTEGQLAVLVGDASGKGLAAALTIASVQASLQTAAAFTGNDLTSLLRVVNCQAYSSLLAGRYATLFYAVLDRAACTLRYVNAGHNPPLILRRDGSTEWLDPSGPPVGLLAEAIWQEGIVRLQPADRLVIYTDGVTEACSPSGEEWGVDGLLRAVEDHSTEDAAESVRSILDAMDDFSGGVQRDDATVAVLRVL
ncbi:MAG TPA: PP2C family protein-serine/threonine phosphatase [Acidobacteriaceae bacterium]|nr:PP2C family protein-serine/threonine phosphatase [Acidobacteriaceae bacterium]